MQVHVFPAETDPDTPHRFLICFEIARLQGLVGHALGDFVIHTLEAGDVFHSAPHAEYGGLIIPLHGSYEILSGTSDDAQVVKGEVPKDPTATSQVVLVEPGETVRLVNKSRDVVRALCISGNAHLLLSDTGVILKQERLANLNITPTWIYLRTMIGPQTVAYHQHRADATKILYSVCGAFRVTLTNVATSTSTRHLLMADEIELRHRSLIIPPLTTQTISEHSRTEPLGRILVFATQHPLASQATDDKDPSP